MYSNYNLENGVATGPARISYPFAADNDLESMVIEQDYFIYASSYTPAVLSQEINIELDLKAPFTSPVEIPKLYRVEDVKKGVNKKILKFAKRWANIPKDRDNIFSGSSTFPFPSFQVVVFNPPASADAAENDENLWKFIETRAANGSPAPVYIDYSYFFKDSPPATLPDVFRPTFGGAAVDFVTDGGSGTFQNSKALNGETFNGTFNVGASDPTLSDYQTKVSNGDMITIDVQIDKYLGDIFEMKKIKMKAQ